MYFRGVDAAQSTVALDPALGKALHRHADGNADVWVSAVVHVIPIVRINHIDIVGLIPVVGPCIWPRIDHAEPITVVLKAWEATNHHVRLVVDYERIIRSKVAVVAVFRDAVTVIAAALLPVAVVVVPVL